MWNWGEGSGGSKPQPGLAPGSGPGMWVRKLQRITNVCRLIAKHVCSVPVSMCVCWGGGEGEVRVCLYMPVGNL